MQPPGGKRKYEAIVTDILADLQARGPLTDVNPGSVVRTLTEAFAREMAEAYERLGVIYEMAYIDTATGESLEHLVALLGQERRQGMAVVGEAAFERDSRVVGRAIIPDGTAMTIGFKTYVTTQEAELKPGQATVTVPIRAEVPAGRQPKDYVIPAHEVGPAALTYPLAGIAGVTIARPTALRGITESDEDLRRRVKGLVQAGGGTRKAMERAILATGKARSVQFRDAESEGTPVLLPGELEVIIDGDMDNPDAYRAVKEAIYESKGPGISVRLRGTRSIPVVFELKVELSGSNMSADRRGAIRRSIEETIRTAMEALGVGQKLLWNPLQAKILALDGVLDLAEARVKVGSAPAGKPDRSVPEQLEETDRLVLPDAQPGVTVIFGDEARVDIKLIVGCSPAAADRAVLARALEDLLRQKNQRGDAAIAYEEVITALMMSAAGGVLVNQSVAVKVIHTDGGEVLLPAGGPPYKLGPDERLYPDPAGFDWGQPT